MSEDSETKPEIGIITALSKEYAAVKKILGNTKDISFSGQGAGRRYLLGEVSTNDERKHTVVLCLASMGNNVAAIRALLLLKHFRDLKSIIMVGIAGGIPHPEKPDAHVRLGDIVISNEKGVIQYDFDKETITENIDRHPPRPPSASLLEGVRLLEADELVGEKPWLKFIDQALLPEGEKRPSTRTDILVSSNNPDEKIKHPKDPKRKNGEPRIFIAPIASANKLLKNPIKRDRLRDGFGVKAVEMEGSGIADATWHYEIGYLVVRGICDYCDSNKGDKWQAYAAAVAAAYTRALLESMPAPKQQAISPNEIDGIPQNLPYSGVVEFVGREEELARLHELLQQENSVSIPAIAGMGGIGKTELALQYARKHFREGSYPGGICWLRATEEVGIQIISFARSCLDLTLPNDMELPEKVTWCLNHWREKRKGAALLIFDDVQKYEDVEPFLDNLRFKILITTRSRFGSSVKELPLDVLSKDKALELLRTLVKDDRIDQQLDQAEQLCKWLGYLPLGLELVGRYLARKQDLSLAQLWQRLQDKRLEARAFKRIEPGMTASLGVAAAFELSWQDLEESAQQLAVVLSLFALAEIPWAMVEQCLPKIDTEELDDIRDEQLVGLHLLKRVDQQTYQLHQLLKEFFASKREQRVGVEELRQKFYEVAVAEAERVRDKPQRTLIQESTLMIAHLRAAIEFLNTPEQEINLANCLFWIAALYEAQGRFGEAEPLYLQARDLHQRHFGDDNPDGATILNSLAHLYDWQGRYSEAEPLYQKSLEIRQRHLSNNHPYVASSLNNLAVLYRTQQRYSEAEPLFLQSLNIPQQRWGDDHPNVASSLNNLAGLYEDQKRYSEAESLYQKSLEIRQRLLGENHHHVATSFNNLGGLYRTQKRYSEAERYLLRSLEIYTQQLGDNHPSVAKPLKNLAALYYSQERYSKAEHFYLRGLAIFLEKLGDGHPETEQTRENFRSLLQKALQENRTGELSDDPMTRSLLQQIQSELDQGNSDGSEQS